MNNDNKIASFMRIVNDHFLGQIAFFSKSYYVLKLRLDMMDLLKIEQFAYL